MRSNSLFTVGGHKTKLNGLVKAAKAARTRARRKMKELDSFAQITR